MLTQEIINEIAGLLALEDQSIWDVGDRINKYELGLEEVTALSGEVDRSVALLMSRAHLAKMFPSDMWDREGFPIGVWEQLSRLEKPADRRRWLTKRTWTVNALRRALDEHLGDPDPPQRKGGVVRVTRFNLDGMSLAMKSELSKKGVLSLTLPTSIAPGTKIETTVGKDGVVQVKIALALEELDVDRAHLRVVR